MKKTTIKAKKIKDKSGKSYWEFKAKGIKKGRYSTKWKRKDVKQFYSDKYINKTGIKWSDFRKGRSKKTKRTKTINSTMKKGIISTDIVNMEKVSKNQIIEHRVKLLKPLIKDNDVLNVMIQDSNFAKLKLKLGYEVTFMENRKKLLVVTIFGKTIMQVQKDLKDVLKKTRRIGTTVELLRKYLNFIGYRESPQDAVIDGIVSQVNCRVTIRKG